MNKQNLVRKDGKGKFDVTVPIPFEFQKYPPKNDETERKKWFDAYLKEKKEEEEKHLNTKIKPTEIP